MKKKTVALLLVLMMVFGITAGGTIAYLTSTTDTVVNTFTVGNVAIKLDEALVDENGKAKADGSRTNETVTGNTYHLVPGGEYDKDPTVTVLSGSDKSYVRMIVKVEFEKVLTEEALSIGLDNIFVGYNSAWDRSGKNVTEEGNDDAKHTVITYEYRYNTTVEGKVDGQNADNKLPALFTDVKVPEAWDNAELEAVGGFKISVVAHAIQAAGFEGDADAAWVAFAE